MAKRIEKKIAKEGGSMADLTLDHLKKGPNYGVNEKSLNDDLKKEAGEMFGTAFPPRRKIRQILSSFLKTLRELVS